MFESQDEGVPGKGDKRQPAAQGAAADADTANADAQPKSDASSTSDAAKGMGGDELGKADQALVVEMRRSSGRASLGIMLADSNGRVAVADVAKGRSVAPSFLQSCCGGLVDTGVC